MLAATDYFSSETKVTGALLASSVGANPAAVRRLLVDLRNAGLIATRRGIGGIALARPIAQISFYDVYAAVEKNRDGIFRFHDGANPNCPVGRDIRAALAGSLAGVEREFEEVLKKYRLDEIARLLREDRR